MPAATATPPTPVSAKSSASPVAQSALSDEILIRCYERSAGYDQENEVFTAEFEELKGSGYLKLPIPHECGGPGLSLAQVARAQRRLGQYAAPTALAADMHL